ncbi:protein FAR1-RELATED SEQUENCE 6-like [Carya illinoinensis]|uniref:protein FAR1-RELATED SEQUENCE 6-like n=1 Tax=Carya illinoinensis TaxID=32201 RepID=UPI001C71ECCD|nr:protein FAR1-RELATED SEQUENCE 6-like [Carya illinoinensis]
MATNIQENAYHPFQYGMRPPTPHIATSSTTSAILGRDDTLDCRETDACTSARVYEENKEDALDPREPNDGTTSNADEGQIDGGDLIEEPQSGIEFNSFEDLLSYYKGYGKRCGFGILTQKSERGEDKSMRYVTLGCARGRKAQNKGFNVANPRPTGKTDCKAKINALKVEGKMLITTVHNEHNHDLSSQKSRFFRCNREVSEAVKRVMDTNDLADIQMNKSFGSLVVGATSFDNLPFLEKDCRNYIDKAQHLRLGAGGAGALRDYFLRMQYKSNGFFASMDLDDDGRLKNVFWADPRSRAAYQYFGDCMDGIAPKAIITNQDRAMKNAIAIVFPESRHRFCLWHILKKVPEKLGSYASYKTGLKNRLMKCVYDTQSVEEFETCWDGLLNTYDLHDNVWLKSLYVDREHWVPEFVDQFDNALKKKIENEMSADFHSFSVTIPYVSRSPIEKRFQELYTNAKFREVQQHILAIFKANGVKSLPNQYILDRWKKDIKRRYTLIQRSYDAEDQSSNTGAISLDTSVHVGSSQQVKSPIVVRGKGRPSSLRKASRMETDMRKRDEGDTPVMNTCRNLFGPSEVYITGPTKVQPVQDAFDEPQSAQ